MMTFYTYDYLQAQQHVTQWVVALGLVLLECRDGNQRPADGHRKGRRQP